MGRFAGHNFQLNRTLEGVEAPGSVKDVDGQFNYIETEGKMVITNCTIVYTVGCNEYRITIPSVECGASVSVSERPYEQVQQQQGMYGQQMPGAYGQPQMYGQYNQQGMYGQQQGMYGQQMPGMYGQQGMYRQQQPQMYGQYNQQGMYGQPQRYQMYRN